MIARRLLTISLSLISLTQLFINLLITVTFQRFWIELV